ncbi:Asp23/Gls24 family envelope stress response protein [Streptomyces sp. NBC_00341]|uniref:Asp23/Gls24 family envelope stress response protein n=1 Tax=unclassified Streptomyces TaxID=2593676 RepID=UPI00093EFE9B|nr:MULTISPECIES: Asp23/Gls24 family envelope stress response protein [unclassified Streptomyces]OKK23852.1 stress-like protein [Streptomyces sp. CB02488]WRZ15791.1 Asp23/Gls24 family envelope stress response protein [Streptomyces sp. NBC_00341]
MATNGSENGTALGSSGSSGGTKGTTVIADTVVSTIAGIAVRETDGVHAIGGGASRAVGAMRDKVSRSNDPGRGVKVEVGEKQAAVDVDIVVEYGTLIVDTAKKIRVHVTDAVETMTGLEVVEINIKVLDVYVPGDDDSSDDDEEKAAPERSRRVQ